MAAVGITVVVVVAALAAQIALGLPHCYAHAHSKRRTYRLVSYMRAAGRQKKVEIAMNVR